MLKKTRGLAGVRRRGARAEAVDGLAIRPSAMMDGNDGAPRGSEALTVSGMSRPGYWPSRPGDTAGAGRVSIRRANANTPSGMLRFTQPLQRLWT